MTQGELADALGLSHGYIGEMERGEKPIERRTELAVALIVQAQHPPSEKASKPVLLSWITNTLALADLPYEP